MTSLLGSLEPAVDRTAIIDFRVSNRGHRTSRVVSLSSGREQKKCAEFTCLASNGMLKSFHAQVFARIRRYEKLYGVRGGSDRTEKPMRHFGSVLTRRLSGHNCFLLTQSGLDLRTIKESVPAPFQRVA